MEKLIAGLRAAAREEQAELAQLPEVLAAPLSPQERAAIVTAIVATDSPPAARTQSPASVPPRRRRRTGFLMMAGGAAAGLLAVGLIYPRASHKMSTLPPYQITVTGGMKEYRGGDESAAVLQAGAADAPQIGAANAPRREQTARVDQSTELSVVLRPEKTVGGSVSARAFLVARGTTRALEAEMEIAPSGAVEIRVHPARDVAAGNATLVVAVGAADRVRALSPSTVRPSSSEDGLQWFSVPLDVVPNRE